MDKRNLWWNIVFCIIFLSAIFLRLPPVLHFDVPFHYDSGLTFLEVRNMVLGGDLRLVGPEGGIKGIFFGPAWYYLLGIIFFLTNGDPRGLSLLSFLISIAAIFMAWKIGNKIDKKTGILGAFFFTFSPSMLTSSSSGFVVDTFVLINLIALYVLFPPLSKKKLFFLALLGGLSFHFEPVVAIGFNFALFFLLFSYIKKMQIKDICILVLLWLLPFFPQFVFEVRHNFLQTHAIIDQLIHSGSGLGGNLPLTLRLINRPSILIHHFITATSNDNIFLAFLLFLYFLFSLTSVITLVFKAGGTKLAFNSFILLVIPLLYYIFLFPPGIKNWYYASFPALYGILITLGLSLSYFNKVLKLITFFTLLLFVLINGEPYRYFEALRQGFPSRDPSNLKNELEIIEWIYQDAKENPFVVYTYSPAVYDYPQQYLFWWYARKSGLPYPKDFSYRPKTYDYVPHKFSFTPSPETDDTFITYLIFFPFHPEYHRYWLPEHFRTPFVETQLISKNSFPGSVIVEKRIKQ